MLLGCFLLILANVSYNGDMCKGYILCWKINEISASSHVRVGLQPISFFMRTECTLDILMSFMSIIYSELWMNTFDVFVVKIKIFSLIYRNSWFANKKNISFHKSVVKALIIRAVPRKRDIYIYI